MGVVYEAEQSMGERVRKVALKTLLPELSHDQVVVARFTRECAVVASLEHPNTVRVYDFGKTPEGILYIAMEFVRGRPLGDVIAEGPMSLARCLGIVEQICLALEEAHQQGIVHRDLKPDNVVLTERAGLHDFVKLLDFGIAMRSGHGGKLDTKLTQQGMVLGTPPYMAPEQFSAESLDRTSDIYALGVIVYEMLNGKLPFEADSPWQWAHHHLSSTPDPFRVVVPEAVERVVYSALSKVRQQRPQSAVEFSRQLQAAAKQRENVTDNVGGRPAFRTEPSILLSPPSGSTTDSPAPDASGNTEPPTDGVSGSGRTEPEIPALGAGGKRSVHSHVSTGTAPNQRAFAQPVGAALAVPFSLGDARLPEHPVPALRRKKRQLWIWISGLGLVLLGAVAVAGIWLYDDYFDVPMPPLPSTAAVSQHPDSVVVLAEKSQLSIAQATGVATRPLSVGVRPARPSSGVLTPGVPNDSLARGGATAVAEASSTPTTQIPISTAPSNPFPFPIPFPIPTGVIVNPLPPSTPAATATTSPATPSVAGLASCAQAVSLANSNMDAAVDQYLTCQTSTDALTAGRTRQTLAGIGNRRVGDLAKLGKCAEAAAVVAALSRIGAQARAQAALNGTSCATP